MKINFFYFKVGKPRLFRRQLDIYIYKKELFLTEAATDVSLTSYNMFRLTCAVTLSPLEKSSAPLPRGLSLSLFIAKQRCGRPGRRPHQPTREQRGSDEHLPAPAAMAAAPVSVPRIKLGSQGLEVSAQGLGCMGMSAFYGPPKPEPDMIELIHHAVAAGVTHLDTSDMYGPHTNEILLRKVGQLQLEL